MYITVIVRDEELNRWYKEGYRVIPGTVHQVGPNYKVIMEKVHDNSKPMAVKAPPAKEKKEKEKTSVQSGDVETKVQPTPDGGTVITIGE